MIREIFRELGRVKARAYRNLVKFHWKAMIFITIVGLFLGIFVGTLVAIIYLVLHSFYLAWEDGKKGR